MLGIATSTLWVTGHRQWCQGVCNLIVGFFCTLRKPFIGGVPRNRRSAAGKRPGTAVAEAYDANIDTAVLLGWSYVERLAFATFTEEIASAPSSAQGVLRQLALLYGLTRLERGLAFYLASGTLIH